MNFDNTVNNKDKNNNTDMPPPVFAIVSIQVLSNNISVDIEDTSLGRGENTEIVTSVNVDPVSLT